MYLPQATWEQLRQAQSDWVVLQSTQNHFWGVEDGMTAGELQVLDVPALVDP